ncbi:SDR family NAD(P)-dependent oxidoreductase [Ruegeria sp. 2205SS24-7]|uniref:SDR family NAD(P)-dependent oxidoreductase n=1 Tax=Ruegeria discodermiae TaxID=3064389 RepID=UPI002740DE85|nr:SDR family NAD(P)-dependent oxidoreductase [Ruegeria sp. 2205SS24-7]MDP5219607.1 SDR family NAD(P)-dependent oxidoreductase [Ruegeria sp. 2205SS24-7]
MREWAGKRYWVVGASEGLGAALAEIMSRSGAHLILSARSTDRLEALATDLPGPTEVVPVDVSDDDSLRKAAAQVGEIDGMVFLAGVYWPMAAQEWDYLQANAMADINFTGLMRVLGLTLPPMVARDAGHIVVTGSLSGYRGLPGAVGYAASKAGTMVLTEGLYADLRKTGIDVQLANPGFIRTRLTEKNNFAMPAIMEPERAAQIMFDHMNTDHFQRAFPVPFAWLFRLGQLLPDWLYFRLFA